jgi:predicted RNA-binding Zn ribbon-like protein
MPHRFQLVGGHPTLDFLNTIHDWTVPQPRDYLATFGDAIRFGIAVGMLRPSEARRLDRLDPGTELTRLKALRTSLERVCRLALAKKKPVAADLNRLSAMLIEASRATALRAASAGPVRRTVDIDRAGNATLRLRLVEAAAALLTSTQVERLRACPSCGWFFLDTSKNRSRRWCSMASCGASAKASRYYWRKRAPLRPPGGRSPSSHS